MTVVAVASIGCTSAGVPRTPEARFAPVRPAARLDLRFDNDARDRVHVYLIGGQREWFLGRVEPGAVTTLGIPEGALTGQGGLLRLAVVVDERVTLRAESNPRAITTLAQPLQDILTHRWRYQPGHLTPRSRR